MATAPPDPNDLEAVCQRCGSRLWAARDGQWTLKNAILKLIPGVGLAVRCPERGCGADVPVPWLQLVLPPVELPSRIGVRRRVLVG